MQETIANAGIITKFKNHRYIYTDQSETMAKTSSHIDMVMHICIYITMAEAKITLET